MKTLKLLNYEKTNKPLSSDIKVVIALNVLLEIRTTTITKVQQTT